MDRILVSKKAREINAKNGKDDFDMKDDGRINK